MYVFNVKVVNKILYSFFFIRVIREYFYAIQQHDPGQELKGETETCLKHKEAVDAEEGNTVRGQMAKSESTCPESRVQQQKCDHEETPWTEKGSTLPEELSKIEPIQPGVIKNDYALLEKYGKKSKRSREGPLANAHEKEQTKQVLDERLFASQQPFKKEHIFPENTLASGDSSQIKSQMGVQFLASKDHKQLYHTHLVNKKVSVSIQEHFLIFLFVCVCVCMWVRAMVRRE